MSDAPTVAACAAGLAAVLSVGLVVYDRATSSSYDNVRHAAAGAAAAAAPHGYHHHHRLMKKTTTRKTAPPGTGTTEAGQCQLIMSPQEALGGDGLGGLPLMNTVVVPASHSESKALPPSLRDTGQTFVNPVSGQEMRILANTRESPAPSTSRRTRHAPAYNWVQPDKHRVDREQPPLDPLPPLASMTADLLSAMQFDDARNAAERSRNAFSNMYPSGHGPERHERRTAGMIGQTRQPPLVTREVLSTSEMFRPAVSVADAHTRVTDGSDTWAPQAGPVSTRPLHSGADPASKPRTWIPGGDLSNIHFTAPEWVLDKTILPIDRSNPLVVPDGNLRHDAPNGPHIEQGDPRHKEDDYHTNPWRRDPNVFVQQQKDFHGVVESWSRRATTLHATDKPQADVDMQNTWVAGSGARGSEAEHRINAKVAWEESISEGEAAARLALRLRAPSASCLPTDGAPDYRARDQSRPIPQTAETAPRPPADSTDTWAALPVGRESAKQAVAKGARTGSWTDARVREAEVGDFY